MNRNVLLIGGAVAVFLLLRSGSAKAATTTSAAPTTSAGDLLRQAFSTSTANPAPTLTTKPVTTTSNAASMPFAVGGQTGGITVSNRVNTPAPAPAPAPSAAPAPVAAPAPAPAALGFDSGVRDLLASLIPGYNVTEADAHYWTNHGGADAVRATFGTKPATTIWDNGERFA